VIVAVLVRKSGKEFFGLLYSPKYLPLAAIELIG
jgi:hypothetical protein